MDDSMLIERKPDGSLTCTIENVLGDTRTTPIARTMTAEKLHGHLARTGWYRISAAPGDPIAGVYRQHAGQELISTRALLGWMHK